MIPFPPGVLQIATPAGTDGSGFIVHAWFADDRFGLAGTRWFADRVDAITWAERDASRFGGRAEVRRITHQQWLVWVSSPRSVGDISGQLVWNNQLGGQS